MTVGLWALGYGLVINLITFIMYGLDKHFARNQQWRIPELYLHVLALAGGSVGALTAQKTFRHKTQKQPFQAVFWGIIILQILILGGIIYLNLNRSLKG